MKKAWNLALMNVRIFGILKTVGARAQGMAMFLINVSVALK